MNTSLSERNLPEEFRLNEALIHETARRVVNDAAHFGCDISVTGNTETCYAELFSGLESVIETLMKTDRNRLMQLLYRVDVSELRIKTFSAQFPHESTTRIISHLIIEREFKKAVVFRHFKT